MLDGRPALNLICYVALVTRSEDAWLTIEYMEGEEGYVGGEEGR